MFRCKRIFLLVALVGFANLFFFTSLSQAEDVPKTGQSKKSLRENRNFVISYTTWVEKMSLDDGIQATQDFAQFLGIGFGFSQERFTSLRWGRLIDAALMYGQANGGGSQTVISYQKSHLSWFGAQASARIAYRLNSTVTLSAGPIFLLRNLTWPNNGNPDLSVSSGATANLGGAVDMKIFLNDQWEVRQSIGTLATKASTLWSMTAGYHY